MAHNKKLKTSKITPFSNIMRKKNVMANSRLHQNRIMSEKGLHVLTEVQPGESAVEGDGASEAKDDNETDAGFNDWVSPNHPQLLPFPY